MVYEIKFPIVFTIISLNVVYPIFSTTATFKLPISIPHLPKIDATEDNIAHNDLTYMCIYHKPEMSSTCSKLLMVLYIFMSTGCLSLT